MAAKAAVAVVARLPRPLVLDEPATGHVFANSIVPGHLSYNAGTITKVLARSRIKMLVQVLDHVGIVSDSWAPLILVLTAQTFFIAV